MLVNRLAGVRRRIGKIPFPARKGFGANLQASDLTRPNHETGPSESLVMKCKSTKI